ncbi:MAG: hypothetical protein HYU52_08255 [Acidobacteria bacterium]|nr:hypothetical protein [Acidobacteriota bacterium]
MRLSALPWFVAALIAFPAAGESRIRLENTSDPSSRVTIGFADAARNPARVEVRADGVAVLVVEAPSPRLRLRGGTLQTDPMIDLIARRQLREESHAAVLHVVDSYDTPPRFYAFDGPLVYDDWAGYPAGGACCGAYFAPAGGHRDYRWSGSRTSGGNRGAPTRPARPSTYGGSFRTQGVIAHPRH